MILINLSKGGSAQTHISIWKKSLEKNVEKMCWKVVTIFVSKMEYYFHQFPRLVYHDALTVCGELGAASAVTEARLSCFRPQRSSLEY